LFWRRSDWRGIVTVALASASGGIRVERPDFYFPSTFLPLGSILVDDGGYGAELPEAAAERSVPAP